MTIKISQLTALASITNSTLMAVVDTDGPYITKRIDGSVLRNFFANVATTGNTAQLTVNSNLVPISDAIYNLGAAGLSFGDIYASGTFNTTGAIRNTSSIVSASTTTGALTVTGGVGIGGNINAGNVTATNLTGHVATPTQNQITSLGTLTGLTSSGAINITASTGSDSSTTGALIVAGGAGFGGNVHIPSTYQLHVGSDIVAASFPQSVAQFNSSVNNYQQVVMQNISSGSTASSDYIAVADTGDDSNKYIDMGINSSGYANPDYNISGALDGYMYVNGGNLALGTQSAGKSIVFHTGGTQSANLRARLSDNGLTVNATTATSSITTGALVVNGGAGFAGHVYVGGNIYAGNLVTTNTSTLTVSAPIVYFDASTPYPYNYDIGFYSAFTGGPANVYAHTGFIRNDSDGAWNLFSNIAEPAGGQASLTNAIYDAINTGVHTINGDAVTKLVNGGTSGVGNIGSASGLWNTVFATKLQGTLTSPTQTAITSVGTLTALGVTGTVTAGAFSGPLTGTTAGTHTGAVIGNVTGNVTGNVSGSALTVTQAAQTAITSVGTLTALGVTGTVTAGAFSGPLTGAVTGATAGTHTGPVIGNVTGNASGSALTVTQAAQPVITSVGTLTALAVTGNVSANYFTGSGALLTGIVTSNVGTLNSLTVSGAITVNSTNTLTAIINGGTTGLGNIGASGAIFNTIFATTLAGTLSTAAQPNITSLGALTGLSLPSITHTGTTGSGDIGASGAAFGTVWAKATSAQYADLAENYKADADYAQGTVLEFGGNHEVTIATDNTPRVAGIVSTNPAYLMNTNLTGAHIVALALTGRVPCRVTGIVKKGDMMVAASNGLARATTSPQFGTIIGKALEDFAGEDGIIEVVVGRL